MTREEAYRLAMRACEETWNEKTCKQIREALEQEPCDDAVSRQAVLDLQYRIDDSAALSTRDVVNVEDIEELPSVRPQEQTGQWINGVCDNCKYDWGKDTPIASVPNYCPNCGCRMVEPQERSDKE